MVGSGRCTAEDPNQIVRDVEERWIQVAEKDVLWLCDLPIMSPDMRLEFSNDSTTHGDYRWPSDSDILQPNSGLHALKVGCKANAAFLETENRLCQLITTL